MSTTFEGAPFCSQHFVEGSERRVYESQKAQFPAQGGASPARGRVLVVRDSVTESLNS